ncbi:ABC transporter substrate-binding protein [Cohnella silvisoli]|uniref:Sugar ABC transporter substrate-binding protein n=1 Tax=Cohnella silvisoli TaxID=2873699 RepID=A0ABV1KXX4_9BACL|nr:sugar ABC transporter substrate-binding protein [Cohnella silvisoli]MCD9023746.1 sugar ABC transporter substrate-binding protein [Cohnella silvisoli]
MKKKGYLLLGLIMAVGLTACGNNKSGSETNSPVKEGNESQQASPSDKGGKDADPIVVRFNINNDEISTEQIKQFEDDNPGIKIQREDTDATKLAAQLATGEAPDIIRISGVNDTPSYVIRGIAMDLTPFIQKSSIIREDDLGPATNVFRFDGKVQGQGPIYGIPKDWSPDYTVWYNKKLFEAAGVPIPDASQPMTWKELFELSKKLTITEGDTIKQFGLGILGKSEADLPWLMTYLLSKGVTLSSSDFSSIDYDKPEVKEGLGLWVDAVKANVGPNQINQDKAAWGGEIFLTDRAAMMLSGYWFSGLLRNDEHTKTHLDDFGMLPAPIAEGGKRVSPTGSATGAIINKATKHPEETWKVYEWYFGGKLAEERAKGGWGVPAMKHLVEMLPQTTEFDKQAFKVLQGELNYSNDVLEVNPYLLNGDALLKKHLTPVYFGKSMLDEAMKQLNKDASTLLKEGMSAAQK